jgi:hypothetical protein
MDKAQVGVPLCGKVDHLGRELNADTAGWLQGSEEVTLPAAKFENPFAGFNKKSKNLMKTFVVVSGPAPGIASRLCVAIPKQSTLK